VDITALLSNIEHELGTERLTRLKKNEDSYQQFWLGVLEALHRIDTNKPFVGFLISNGYGAIRNMRRSESSKTRLRGCPTCGTEYGFRTKVCPLCGSETDSLFRLSSMVNQEGQFIEYEDRKPTRDINLAIDIESFLTTLEDKEYYVAKRWMMDRADLLFANHVKQIAFEMEISAPRVTQIKNVIRKKFKSWYFDINE